MSGRIELKIRLAKSNDKRYDSYPEWFIEVTDESDENKKVRLSPTWEDIKNFIKEVKLHELRINLTRERKNDADHWDWALKTAIKEAQKELSDFEIPDIYNKPKFEET